MERADVRSPWSCSYFSHLDDGSPLLLTLFRAPAFCSGTCGLAQLFYLMWECLSPHPIQFLFLEDSCWF